MNKRERFFSVLEGRRPDRIPTGFWMHFPPDAFFGDKAVETHLDYFEKTQTDICKVMTEHTYPCEGNINTAADWEQVRSYGSDAEFIQKQAEIIKRVVDRCPDGVMTATIHGVIASASHALLGIPKYDSVGRYAQLYHLRTNPQAVNDAYQRIAETLCVLVRAAVAAGAEGIYYAALGGESDGFTQEEHACYIAPLDKMIIRAAYEAGAEFVILHMCKPKVELKRFLDYPCDIVNWGVRESGITLAEGHRLFPDKVILGGLDNHQGPLINGTEEELNRAVGEVIDSAGTDRLILGSDCTLPGDLPYSRIAQVAWASERYACRHFGADVGQTGDEEMVIS